MSAPAANYSQQRRQFVAALERSKVWIASTPDLTGKRREGSNRSLSKEVGVSPGRVGEFLDAAFWLPVIDGSELVSASKIKKIILGFATSVERALQWLRLKGLEKDPSDSSEQPLTTDGVVKGYWPHGDNNEFGEAADSQTVEDGLREGVEAVRNEVAHWSKVKIQLKVLPWGPFGDGKKSKVEGEDDQLSGFLRAYGKALVNGIDPIESDLTFTVAETLAEALDLPSRSRRESWASTLGLYDTPYRRFAGFRFVTFPVRVPLIGLSISRGETSDPAPSFEDAFGKPTDRRLFAVNREVGHLFLGAALPDEHVEKLSETLSDPELAEALRKASHNGEVTFLSDGILALAVFSILSRQKGYSVRPIPQDPGHERELSFRIGFMLRQEDTDLIELLETSQCDLFRAQWRALNLFQNLFEGVAAWLEEIEFSGDGWAAKVFLLEGIDLRDVVETHERAAAFLDAARKKLPSNLTSLFQLGDPI